MKRILLTGLGLVALAAAQPTLAADRPLPYKAPPAYAPIFSWLLLVSAWARRTVFLWAALPPLTIGVVEKIAFNTSHFAAMLGHLFSGGEAGAASTRDSMSMGALTTGYSLSAPSFWVGLAFAAACLAAAVRLRRNREPI